jgi:hypothetical protein
MRAANRKENSMSYFSTSVSEVTEGVVNLRGYSLADIMKKAT